MKYYKMQDTEAPQLVVSLLYPTWLEESEINVSDRHWADSTPQPTNSAGDMMHSVDDGAMC